MGGSGWVVQLAGDSQQTGLRGDNPFLERNYFLEGCYILEKVRSERHELGTFLFCQIAIYAPVFKLKCNQYTNDDDRYFADRSYGYRLEGGFVQLFPNLLTPATAAVA